MQTMPKRLNKGFEIQLYYPKDNGKYTQNTGNEKEVVQCDNVKEVAQWFARNSWGSIYGDSNYANPTVWLDGKPWCRGKYSKVIN